MNEIDRRLTFALTLLILVTGVGLAPASADAAVPLYAGEDTSVGALLLTRAGYRVNNVDGETSANTFLRFGRIGVTGSVDGLGSAKVVGEFAGGAQLLDIIGQITMLDPVTFRAGFYKSPLSLEFDTPPDAIPFVGRTALLGRIAPVRLAGTEVELNLGSPSGLSFEGRLGLWNPAEIELAEPVGYRGQYVISSAQLGWGSGRFRAAFLKHVFADNPTAPALRVAPYDEQLDVGVELNPGPARIIVEGLVAFDGPLGDTAYGAHAQAFYRLGNFDEAIAYAPAIAYDFIDDAQLGEEHTGRVGVNLHYRKLAFVLGIYYGARYFTESEDVSNTGEVQLQVSL